MPTAKAKGNSNWKNYREKMTHYLFGPHLEDGERILLVAHRHPFLMVKRGAKIGVLFFFIPIFLWFVFPEGWFIFLIWVIYGFIAFNKMIFNWYFDAVLITNMSLVDVTWNGPFDRSSVRVEYAMVEGTSYHFKGILQTLFNYGTIQVTRLTGVVAIEQKDVINPAKVESVLLSYQEQYLSRKSMQDSNALKNLLSEMVKKHTTELNEIEVDY